MPYLIYVIGSLVHLFNTHDLTPMKIACIRHLRFCAGHRLLDHEGQCRHLHGHNYQVELHASAQQLDPLGRVVEFGVLKQRIGTWIDTHWDHAFIRAENDTVVAQALALADSKEYVLPYNPTAENIARYLLLEICPRLLHDVPAKVVKVVVHETENCMGVCSL